jgi:membrane protease YdiL (CAAX protease family)
MRMDISIIATPDFDRKPLYYLPLWLTVAVVNGLAENLAVMGYPLFRLASDTGWVAASLLVGLLFAAAHLGNPS